MHPAFQRVYLVWAWGHAHHSQLSSCTVRFCPATIYGREIPGWAQTPQGPSLTATTKALSLQKGVWTPHTPSWGINNSLPSNTFLLKTHSKDCRHRKFCKQDNFINFKSTPKTTKATQNKTCWMKTVKNNFTALTKKNDIHLQHFFSKFTWQRLRYCFILTQHTTALRDWLCYFGKSWDLWTRKSGAH